MSKRDDMTPFAAECFEVALKREAYYMGCQFDAERRNDHQEAAAMSEYRIEAMDSMQHILEDPRSYK
jgi:hypothetical protein